MLFFHDFKAKNSKKIPYWNTRNLRKFNCWIGTTIACIWSNSLYEKNLIGGSINWYSGRSCNNLRSVSRWRKIYRGSYHGYLDV